MISLESISIISGTRLCYKARFVQHEGLLVQQACCVCNKKDWLIVSYNPVTILPIYVSGRIFAVVILKSTHCFDTESQISLVRSIWIIWCGSEFTSWSRRTWLVVTFTIAHNSLVSIHCRLGIVVATLKGASKLSGWMGISD